MLSLEYAEDDIVISLAFGLEAVPEARLITQCEILLLDVAEKRGSAPPGWEIAPK